MASTTALNRSGTRSRTSTPVRAITSTLTARAAPSIPPASQTYDPLVKSVLRQRLVSRVFTFSAASVWTLSVVWSAWCQDRRGVLGALLDVVRPTTLGFAVLGWVVGTLPLVILRKAYLTAVPALGPSPSQTIRNALSKSSTFRALIVYAVSSVLLAFLHVLTAYTYETNDPRLAVFVKSRKHPYYFNGRFLYLVLFQVTLAVVFLLRNTMLDRNKLRWNMSSASSPVTIPSVLKTILTAILLPTLTIPVVFALFFVFRSLFLPLLLSFPISRAFLRPCAAHFVRGPWTLTLPFRHLGLLLRAWAVGASTVAQWEFAEELFDTIIAQPVKVAAKTSDPALTLISGLATSTPSAPSSFPPPPTPLQYFALSELFHLASDPSPPGSARRTALFADQKYTPGLWATLVREALLFLGRDYQLLLRRGKPPLPAPAPAPAPPSDAGPKTPRAELLHTPIFKSSPRSPLSSVVDSLASDGTVPHAVDSVGVPELADALGVTREVRRVEAGVKGTVAQAQTWVRGKVATTSGRVWGGASVRGSTSAGGGRWGWWSRERQGRVAEGSLPNREMDIMLIGVLARLTCASLEEDRYGVVQRDIPRILEALLKFLDAVEEYQAEIGSMAREEENAEAETERARDVLGGVTEALKDGVVSIVRTFGDKLLAFKFPPRTARKLQGFVDYS